jgi:predicted acylesterase/phospholipase RssA
MAYRVLALDGGGVWALTQVYALISLYSETTTGRQVLQDFDLVAGTSGGAIVLGGLVEDVTLGELRDFFQNEKNRRSLFSPTHMIFDQILIGALGAGPKYSAKAKLPALEALMPQHGMAPLTSAADGVRRPGKDVDTHLLITAFDYDRNRAQFFRSAPATRGGWGQGDASGEVTLCQAIHASSNAPVLFFDEPAMFNGGRYWDGAITGNNNPVLVAVTEAIVLDNQPDNIIALSIGTGTPALLGPPGSRPGSPYYQLGSNQNLAGDLQKLAGSVTDDPPDIATYLAYVMTGGPDGAPPEAATRVVRLNPLISPETDVGGTNPRPPGPMSEAQFDYLVNDIPMDAVEQPWVEYIASYAQYWVQDLAPNQPIRMDGDSLAPEIGHAKFSDAAKAWASLKALG